MATLPSLPSSIQLPGSVIDAATRAANSAKAAAEAALPSFNSLMDAAKTSLTTGVGGLFKDVSATLNSVGASQFGIGSETPDVAAFEAYKKQVADVQKNAMIDMAIAKAALAQKVKEASAAGQAISAEVAADALNATKSLQNLQSNLTNPAALAADAAASAAAKAAAITSLKADAMLAMLSKPMPTALAGAVGSNMNAALVNDFAKLNIIKAQESSITQPVPGQAKPAPSIRPADTSITASLDSKSAVPAPVAPPSINNRVYKSQVLAYETKKDNSKIAYLAYLGLTWSKGQPDFTKAERDASLLSELKKVYDVQVGRTGAEDDRVAANAIKKAKPPADRTPEETALIDKVEEEKKIFYTKSWWTTKNSLYQTYSDYFDNYKLVYDCWINNGDRFSLPADRKSVV